jgi:ABC-type nitrate/sulfonate/bicarbonate transport system substrate-binding protein
MDKKLAKSLLFGCLLISFTTSSADKIKVGYVSFVGDVTTYIAHKKGFFAEQDLEVELVHNKAGVDSLRQLVNGDIHIGAVAPTPMIYSMLKINDIDDSFKIIARISESTNVNHLIVLDTEKTPTIKDLEGKNIAITLGTDSEFFWHNLASAYSIGEHSVTFVDTPVPNMKDLANNPDIAAVICWSPFHEDVMSSAKSKYKTYSGDAFYTSSWLMVVTPKLINTNPNLIKRYLKAMMKAEQLLLEDPQQVANMHHQLVHIPADILVERYLESYFELSLSESIILNLSLQSAWVTNKVDKDIPTPNIRSYFEPKFLQQLRPDSVSLLE